MSPRNPNLKSKEPRRRKARLPWQQQVNPAFADLWRARKENRERGGILDDKRADEALYGNFKRMGEAQRRLLQKPRGPDSITDAVWSAILAPLDGEVWPWPVSDPKVELKDSYAQNPEANSIFRTLVFLEHGITFRELVTRSEAQKGEEAREAHDMLLRVHRDWYRMRWEGRSFEAMKLRFNMDHFGIILDGIDYGLEKLDEAELAECLDDICPCGREKHSPDYIKKLKIEILRVCRKLVADRHPGTASL